MTALRATYAFIEAYHTQHGIAPTEREIGEAFGITSTGAHHRLNRLQALGWIARGGIRSIVLLGMK